MVRHDKSLRRTWVLGARIHHGLVGLGLFAAGVWLMWDDRHDRWWFHD